MPLAVVPVNSPWSSVTVGPVYCLGREVVAKTVEAAAQIATSDTRRKAMITRESDLRVLGGSLSFKCLH